MPVKEKRGFQTVTLQSEFGGRHEISRDTVCFMRIEALVHFIHKLWELICALFQGEKRKNV